MGKQFRNWGSLNWYVYTKLYMINMCIVCPKANWRLPILLEKYFKHIFGPIRLHCFCPVEQIRQSLTKLVMSHNLLVYWHVTMYICVLHILHIPETMLFKGTTHLQQELLIAPNASQVGSYSKLDNFLNQLLCQNITRFLSFFFSFNMFLLPSFFLHLPLKVLSMHYSPLVLLTKLLHLCSEAAGIFRGFRKICLSPWNFYWATFKTGRFSWGFHMGGQWWALWTNPYTTG